MIAQRLIPEPAMAGPPSSLQLVEELNHRVANQFAEAIATLSLAASRTGDGEARRALASASDRLRDHAASHRALLPPLSDLQTNLADYVGHLCQAFTKAMLAERGVRLVLEAAEISMSAYRSWRMGLVLAELIRNAARHGLHGQSGQITVRMTEFAGWLDCLVCDSGRAAAHAVAGHGQRLLRSLVAELGGTIEWTFTPNGNFALVQVPIVEADQGTGALLLDGNSETW